MKKVLLATLLLMLYNGIQAQVNERESNNTFATADTLHELSIKKGTINSSPDNNDYFKTLLPADGTMKIVITGTNTGGSNGYFYIQVYNKKHNGLVSKVVANNTSVGVGKQVKDTVTLYGLGLDSMYINIYADNQPFSYQLSYQLLDRSTNDIEPNNSFAQAIQFAEGQVKSGHIGYTTNGAYDANDYYKTLPAADGTLKLYVSAKNNGGSNGYIYVRANNKKGDYLYSNVVAANTSVKPGQTVSDTVTLYSTGRDSIYYSVYADNQSFSYQLSYKLSDTSAIDKEPNDTKAKATTITKAQVIKGHIGYVTNAVFDQNDYYKTAIPQPGTIKIAVSALNTGGSNGYMYFMVYNKKSDVLLSRVVANNTNVGYGKTVKDTLVLYSLGLDTMYFGVYADNRSFSYQFSYNITDVSDNDTEPNDAFAQATNIGTNELKKGHIGYTTNGAFDQNDFYKTLLPADGTVKLYVSGTNTGGSNGYFYIQAYNKKGDNLLSKVVANNTSVAPNKKVSDTISLYSIGKDSMYFKIYADNQSFSYQLHYELTGSSAADKEPNDKFQQATFIKANDVLKGHIGYTTNGAFDQNDDYKTLLPAEGTMRLIVSGTNTGGGNGYFYIQVYNKKGNNLLSKVVANNNSVAYRQKVTDTIKLYSLGKDSMYINIYADNKSFSYQLSYTLLDSSATDKEPNNTLQQATNIKENDIVKGHIGYTTNGEFDQNDYYKTLHRAYGTSKLIVAATNTGGSNGYVYIRIQNKKGDYILSKVVANNTGVKPGETIRDTIKLYSLGKDSMYYGLYADNQSFAYQFSYQLIDTAAADKEVNNTRQQATLIKNREVVKGNIGYITNGVYDADDYYKGTVLPVTGTVKIIVSGTNTGDNNGYFYVRAYDKANNNILSKVVGNNTSVAPGKTVTDTVYLNCYNSDSVLLDVFADNKSFRYQLSYTYTSGPVANFGYIKYGNKFSFIDSSKNLPPNNTYLWQFYSAGNQIGSSTLSKPDFNFPADAFNTVKLTVGNGCLVSSVTLPLVQAGKINYYSPSVSQANTEVLVNFTGGALDKNAKVFLKKKSNPAISYTPLRIGSPSQYQLAAYFDLHSVTATGDYFLQVNFSNGAKDTLPFTVLPYSSAEANVQLSISGPGFMRNGLTSYYNLTVSNTSNKQALGVPVWFAIPNELEAQVMVPTVKLKRISKGIQDTVPLYATNIGTIDGVREERKVFFMMLGTLGAKETVTIPVKVTQPLHAGKQTKIFAWADKPMYGSPMKDNWVKTLKSISKFVSGRYVDSTCSDSALSDGGWEAINQAIFNGDSTGTNIISNYYLYTEPLTWKLVDLVFHCYSDVHITKNMMYSLIYNSLFVAHLDDESAPPPGGPDSSVTKLGGAVKDANNWDNNKNDDVKPPVLDSIPNCTTADCFGDPFDFDKLKNRANPKIKPVINPDNPTIITEIIISIDPNRIDGPSGYTSKKHVKQSGSSAYSIHFENKPEATASAQNVQVLDTLDQAKYNYRTFSLSSFTIGDSLYLLPPGAKEYSTTVGIKQFNNVKVWFYAKFDTLTGILNTKFTAVDPATDDVIPVTDARGFLPPNTTSPNGEGSVTYNIAFKQGLASGTQVSNTASIIFDANEPLLTNTWNNIIDTTAPTGKIVKAVRVNDSTAMLVLTGNDAHSGVRMYRIYSSRNGGAFTETGFATSDTVYFSGFKGSSYAFYADVFDSVYNHTTKSAISEASVALPVTMLPLTGNALGKINNLYWTTVTESNNDGFYVERSTDGFSFSSIGFVTTKAQGGYSAQNINYTYTDVQPAKHNWYRLKQVDKDGRYSYSNTIDLNNTVTSITMLYPNPAKNNFFISSDKMIISIRLVDAGGRAVKQFTPSPRGSSYNITGLPAGTYFCEIVTDNGKEVSKLVIQ